MPVRRRQPRRQETGAAERYREMGIAAALARPCDYPTACAELAALLRRGYAQLPKAAQALVAVDVLLAFRLLPDVQTGYAVTAANNVLQAVEVALPKQKKAQAASEFKRSVVAHKRRARVQQEIGSPHIPQDVLVHIFSFLDMRSLVAAGLVCWYFSSHVLVQGNMQRKLLSRWKHGNSVKNTSRQCFLMEFPYFHLVSGFHYIFFLPFDTHGIFVHHTFFFLRRSWNSAAIDNDLWRINYSLFFGTCNVNGVTIPLSGVQNIHDLAVQNSMDSVSIYPNFCWKELFRNKYAECATWRFVSNRALCGHCRSVIWLSNLTCASPHHCSKLRPLLPDTVAEYILHAEDLAATSSDCADADSDSDDEYEHRRFWLL